MTPTPPDKDKIDEILEQLQYGTVMADNTEPALTNNRNIAKQAINRLIVEEQLSVIELLFWKYKELNSQSVDVKFAEAYGIIKDELEQSLKETEK